jgi:hypothetical protein
MSSYAGNTSDELANYVCVSSFPGLSECRLNAYSWVAGSYIPASLHYLLYVDESSNIGLTGGSLYDVPETKAAIGTITVGATGFNITCEFLEGLTAIPDGT